MARSSFSTALIVGAVASTAVPPAAWAAEARGSLQGVDTLQPTPPPALAERLRSYWEEQNGALAVRAPHANVERDVSVVVTGPGITESSQPVDLPVSGGRCQPGTAVVTRPAVLRVQNRDWFSHEFFATRPDAEAPVELFRPETTAPNGARQVQLTEDGTYVIRDRLQPTFRCWIVVGPGQGRVVAPAADNSFRVPNLSDGEYALKVYFEGRVISATTVRIANNRDAQVPAINLAAPPPAPAPGAGGAAPPGPGGAQAPGAPAAPAAPTRRRRGL